MLFCFHFHVLLLIDITWLIYMFYWYVPNISMRILSLNLRLLIDKCLSKLWRIIFFSVWSHWKENNPKTWFKFWLIFSCLYWQNGSNRFRNSTLVDSHGWPMNVASEDELKMGVKSANFSLSSLLLEVCKMIKFIINFEKAYYRALDRSLAFKLKYINGLTQCLHVPYNLMLNDICASFINTVVTYKQ